MPDRHLREVQLGVAGRLGSIETKQRAASLRVWPGALRTGDVAQYTPLINPATFNRIIEVETLPGRWMVWGQFDLFCASAAGLLRYEFKLAAFDTATDIEESSADYDFPTYYYWAYEAAPNPFRFPVTLVGHFSNETDDNKKIAILCRDDEAHAWSAQNIRLNLIPR